MEQIKLNENERIKNYEKAKEELGETLKELGLVASVYLLGGLLVMICWNEIALLFGFKCVSYVIATSMFMLARVLFKRE